MQEQYIWIDIDETKRYYKDKRMTIYHRTDGPAVEGANGYKVWYVDGKCHRTDGPAIIWAYGTKIWYVDNNLHRLDGPAFEWFDGSKEWWVNGKLHRLDGPAVEWADGSKQWYVDDKQLTEEQFNALTSPTLELTLEEIAAEFGVDASKIKIKK